MEAKKWDCFTCNAFPDSCVLEIDCDDCRYARRCWNCVNAGDQFWCEEHCNNYSKGIKPYEN